MEKRICVNCQKSKSNNKPTAPHHLLLLPSQSMDENLTQRVVKLRSYDLLKSKQLRTLLLLTLCLVILPSAVSGAIYRIPVRSFRRNVAESVLSDNPLSERDAELGQSGDAPDTSSPLVSKRKNLMGMPGEGYYVEIAVGTPPQLLNVLVDTGSSNFALAAAPDPDIDVYFRTSLSSSYEDVGRQVSVPYTQGKWEGPLGRDLVTLTSMDNITVRPNIAFITESEDFFIPGSNWQGILGLAYAEIARPDSSVEPFLDTLERETNINRTFSLQLCGPIDVLSDTSMDGSMVIGGIDTSLYDGPLLYVPMYKEWYYEVVITNIYVNGQDIDLDCKEYNFDKTIVDSGTTNLRLPHRTYTKVLAAIQNNTQTSTQTIPEDFWSGDDLLCWPENKTPWNSFPSVEVSLAKDENETITIVVSPQQYLRAVTETEVLLVGMNGNNCYKFAISASDTGTVLGAVVMEGYYVVFDRENGQVGFAKSTCNNRDPTTVQPSVTGPHSFYNTMECAYIKPPNRQATLITVAYVMAGLCSVCLLPLVYVVVQWQVSKCKQRKERQQGVETASSDINGLLNDVDDIPNR